MEPGPVDTYSGPGLLNTNWGPGPRKTNWGTGSVNTNRGPGSINRGPGPEAGALARAGGQAKGRGPENTNSIFFFSFMNRFSEAAVRRSS